MFLSELDTKELQNVCFTAGSTHILKTCQIGEDKYYLKFSDDELFDSHDPSLQILIEYLAYKIYSLYPSIHIPKNIHLVYDKQAKKVGLATQAITGNKASHMPPDVLAKKLSAGVYVDIFLANWDVIGVGATNVVSNEDSYRIDPGGALTFRAQGGRKGKNFSDKPSELKTMLDPSSGAGAIFQYSDLKVAAKTFLSVDYQKIAAQISNVYQEVSNELKKNGLTKLLTEWDSDVNEINSKLKPRYETIVLHAKKMLTESAFKLHGYDLLLTEFSLSKEKDLVKAIDNHIGSKDEWSLLSTKHAKKIKTLIDKEEDDLFVEPDKNVLYRGMALSKVDFIKLFGFWPKEKSGSKEFKREKFCLKPKKKSGVSSWSKNLSVAKQFTKNEDDNQDIEVVLVSSRKDNDGDFFDLENWYEEVLIDYPEGEKEREVIGLGEILCSELRWKLSKGSLKEYVDEPEGGRFGKVLFGSQRKDDVEKEPDTTEEEEIFWALEDHYNVNADNRLEASATRIIDLAKSGKYKNILQPPDGFVYRIIRVNKDNAERLFVIPKEVMEEEMYGYKDLTTPISKKDNMIQSWSFKPKPNVLSDFIDTNLNTVGILLKAKCPDGGKFFMNPYGINNLKKIDKWHNEKEVISYGTVKIVAAAYFCPNPFFKVDGDEVVEKLLKLCGEI